MPRTLERLPGRQLTDPLSIDAVRERGTVPPRTIAEEPEGEEIVVWRHPEWVRRWPWLIQGTTGRGGSADESGFGLFGSAPVGATIDRWRRLRETTGMPASVHSRQVHGARVAEWETMPAAGLVVTEGSDAHLTREPGILLTVSVADCVPVFLVSDATKVVAVAHAGWRGVAAGVVEAVIERMSVDEAGREDIWLHCGPAICGKCYEVGPEVHEAIRPGSVTSPKKGPIDLSQAIAERAARAGIAAVRVTASSHCTRCGPPNFFSHRGGSAGRQVGVIGVRV